MAFQAKHRRPPPSQITLIKCPHHLVCAVGVVVLVNSALPVGICERAVGVAVSPSQQVTKINRFHRQINGNDKVTLTLKVSANLESLFTWNTKQVFVFVTAEYENAKNLLNQISLWDHIIPDKEHANLQLEGSNLRGKKIQLVLHWYIMPNVGAMIQDRMALSEFKLSDIYTS